MLYLIAKQTHDLVCQDQQNQHQVNGKQNVWKIDFYSYAPEKGPHFIDLK